MLLGTREGLKATRLPRKMETGWRKPALCFPAAVLNVPLLP